jgi:Domain of unknown function (DUF4926)
MRTVASSWGAAPALRNVPSLVMADTTEPGDRSRDFLGVVALLRDLPELGLVRGQVGAVVEPLDKNTALIKLNYDKGRAYAIVRSRATPY